MSSSPEKPKVIEHAPLTKEEAERLLEEGIRLRESLTKCLNQMHHFTEEDWKFKAK